MALLAFRISRVPISTCAPSVFARVACRPNGVPNNSRVSLLRTVGARLLRRRSSLSSLVATTSLLAFRISRVPTSACASGALGLRSRCLSSLRRPESLARLSSLRVSLVCASCAVDLPSRRSSQRRRCLRFASVAFPHRRAPQAPSAFACVARRHDRVLNHSHVSRAPVPSARACFAFGLFSHRSSPRRRCLSLAPLVFLISACASGADGLRSRCSSLR